MLAGLLVVGVLKAQRLGAQSPAVNGHTPVFEVASIKPNKSGTPGMGGIGFPRGGRFSATRVSLRELIRLAYRRQVFESRQMVGGPSWIDSDRFDIEAKAAREFPRDLEGFARQTSAVLQALVAERFKLTVHNETRELPIHSLVLSQSGRKTGRQLRRSQIDCAALFERRVGRPPVEPGKAPPSTVGPQAGHLTVNAVTISQLANVLSPFVNRVVLDRTGLIERFDVDLQWTPDLPSGPPRERPLGEPTVLNGQIVDLNGPSIFTALQEQLGLKLESERGPVDVLVIDHAEDPTED